MEIIKILGQKKNWVKNEKGLKLWGSKYNFKMCEKYLGDYLVIKTEIGDYFENFG